jgi:hypothetical protein
VNRLSIYLILFAAQLVPGIGTAQWTPEQCKEFVQIYFETEKPVRNPDTGIDSLLEKYQVSTSRFREMLELERGGRERTGLTENEAALAAALKQKADALRGARERAIKEVCKDRLLSYDEYVTIRSRYQTDIAFQRSMKPYFEQYFKSLK